MQELVDQTYEARDRLLYDVLINDEGYTLNADVVSSLGPGPPWPNLRQAHRVLLTRNEIGHHHRALIVSDGLSDPCYSGQAQPTPGISGFGYEIIGEFTDSTSTHASKEYCNRLDQNLNPTGWLRTWEVLLTHGLSQQIAGMQGGAVPYFDRWNVVTTEVPVHENWGVPPSLVHNNKVAVVTFESKAPWLPTNKMESRSLSYPAGSARLFAVRVISPSQLATILSSDDPKRAKLDLIQSWAEDGSHHVSDMRHFV